MHALDRLQLKVPEGSIYALIGPNGAGRTALMKLLVNIPRPTSGRALLLDTDSRQPFTTTICSNRLCIGEPGTAFLDEGG